MDFIFSSANQQQIAAKLVDAGVLVFQEGGAKPVEGVLFSYIGEQNGSAFAFVSIDEAIIKNAATIVDRLKADINKPGSPLRAKLGSAPPAVINTLPDWAYRKALNSLKLEIAWDTAIGKAATKAGNKDVSIWWERSLQISTLEPEWVLIVAEMVWGTKSEADLIAEATSIYNASIGVATAAEEDPII